MRIAVFHNLLKGGAKRSLYEFSRNLSKKHFLDLYCFSESKEEFLPRKTFFKRVYRFDSLNSRNFLEYQFLIYKKLPEIHKIIAKEIDKRKYDVVFVNPDYLTKAPYILQFLKTQSVYLCQEPPREFYEHISLYSPRLKYKIINVLRLPLKKIDYYNARKATLILANSYYSRKVLTGIYKYRVRYLRHGVNTRHFKFLGISRKEFFLTVGALSRFKGYDFLIKAISRLPKEKRYPLLAVADGGRDEKFIKRLALNLKVELIVKSGLDDVELINLYNKAMLFLFAGMKEPLGLSILEAASCGLSTIAVNEGGVAEAVDKKYGILVKRKEADFANAINKVLDGRITVKVRKELSERTKKKWSWKGSMKDFENYLFLAKNENSNC